MTRAYKQCVQIELSKSTKKGQNKFKISVEKWFLIVYNSRIEYR